jgi:site-specific DNA-methyltransferase (adenine-specific)
MAYMDKALSVDWATPQDLYNKLNERYGFTLDVAASSTNHKCPDWFGLDHPDETRRDGLKADWYGTVWCNPPYGRVIRDWVKKAYIYQGQSVLLVPSRTDTAWFHDYCYPGNRTTIQFIRGRLKFGDGTQPAPFPSMLVIFHGKP